MTVEFSENTSSVLAKLYETEEDIGHERAFIVDEANGSKRYASDIVTRVSRQPFVAIRGKTPTLDLTAIARDNATKAFAAKLDALPQCAGNKSAFMELVLVEKNERVKAWNSERKNGKLFPPRMLIDLSGETIEPGDAVRINTGYVIRVPFIAKTRTVEKNGTVNVGARAKQPDFVVVPLVAGAEKKVDDTETTKPEIIVACCPRDPDDTGLLTLNFTLLSGSVSKLRVVFNAYATCRPLTSISLVHPEPNTEIFKPKDSRNGRFVKNPKVKIHYDSLTREVDGSANLKTFNSLVSPPTTYERQRVNIVGQTVMFVNRKREWFNPSLICTPGIYNHRGDDRTVVPGVYRGGDDNRQMGKNTHCMVFVEGKLPLFSEFSQDKSNLTFVNGAFSDIHMYDDIYKSMKQLIRGLQGLKQGYERCATIKTRYPELGMWDMLRLYDYHRSINDRLDELKEKIALTDEEMFESQTGRSSPYSRLVFRALKTLADIYPLECRDDGADSKSDEHDGEPVAKIAKLT